MVSTKLLCAATSELCNSSSHSVELNVYITGKLQSWPTFDQFWGLGFVWSRSNISRFVHLNSIITSTIYIGDLGMISLWMSIVQCSVVMYSVYQFDISRDMSGTTVYACEYPDCSIHHDNILFFFDIRGAVHACEYPLYVEHPHECLSLTLEVEL